MNIGSITQNFTDPRRFTSRKAKGTDESSFAARLKTETQKDSISAAVCGKKEDTSLEEYKWDFYRKISKLSGRWNTSGNICSVFISDEGFEAMRSNPEYEKWVMSQINSTCGGYLGRQGRKKYSAVCIGGTKEDCRFESWTDISPTKEEYEQLKEIRRKRLEKLKKLSLEKYDRYKKALRENSLKKSRMEAEHIKGNYDDMIYRMKNLSAESYVSTLLLFRM